MRDQRLQLRAEQQQPARQQRVVQRLDAEPVAGEEERLAIPIPQREREHAAEPLDAVLAPLLPGMNDHLGVAAGPEAVSKLREFRDQRLIVVDLAVEDDDHAAVLVEQRLLPGGEVDDREPAMAEPQAGLGVQPDLVRPAMVLGLVHARNEVARDRPRARDVHDADNAAHDGSGLSGGRSGHARRRRVD